MVTIAFGMSLYMGSDLGMATYDCASFLLSEYLHKDAFMLRVILDSLVAAMMILLKGPINVEMILPAFFTGPLVGVFSKVIKQRLKNTEDIWSRKVFGKEFPSCASWKPFKGKAYFKIAAIFCIL